MFVKINNYSYTIDSEFIKDIEDYVINVIMELTVDNTVNYNDSITDNLFATILSRRVASLFIKHNNSVIADSESVVINVQISTGKTYAITVGSYSIDGKVSSYAHGVLNR